MSCYVLSGPTHAKPFLLGKRGTDFGTWKAGSCTCQRIKDSSAGFALNMWYGYSSPYPTESMLLCGSSPRGYRGCSNAGTTLICGEKGIAEKHPPATSC